MRISIMNFIFWLPWPNLQRIKYDNLNKTVINEIEFMKKSLGNKAMSFRLTFYWYYPIAMVFDFRPVLVRACHGENIDSFRCPCWANPS